MTIQTTRVRLLLCLATGALAVSACKTTSEVASGGEEAEVRAQPPAPTPVAKPTTAPPVANKPTAMTRNKTPLPTNDDFRPATAILPRDGLLRYLNEHGSSRMLKIPVVIHRQAEFPRAITEAFIAVDEGMADDDKLRLHLDDSGMGIALSSHLRDKCGDATLCKLWLMGTWGALLDLPKIDGEAPSKPTDIWPFAVRGVNVEGPEAITANRDARVWVIR